jgi:hypothetical protein
MNPRLALELTCRRHGWPVLLGLVVLIVLSMIALTGLATPAPPLVAATGISRQNEEHYRVFRAILIPRDELEVRQNAVFDLALRHGLVPGRIDYGLEHNETGRFDVATIAFPLRGGYADFQGFLTAALATEPALGVAELAVQRDATGSGIVAQLRLVFHAMPAERVRP